MAANKATRRGSQEPRTPVPVREVPPESAGSRLEPDAAALPAVDADAPPSAASLEALERAADNIRPSWHGAPMRESPAPARLSAPVPAFEAFPIEPAAPQYNADSTLRTSPMLHARLQELLDRPQVVRASQEVARASRWLRARPLVLAGLGASLLLLLMVALWPASDEGPERGPLAANMATRRAPPPPPPPPARAAPVLPAESAAAPGEASSGSAETSEVAAPTRAKRREKRAAKLAAKPVAGKPVAPPQKPSKLSAPAR